MRSLARSFERPKAGTFDPPRGKTPRDFGGRDEARIARDNIAHVDYGYGIELDAVEQLMNGIRPTGCALLSVASHFHRAVSKVIRRREIWPIVPYGAHRFLTRCPDAIALAIHERPN